MPRTPATRATWTTPCKVGPAARLLAGSHALLHLAHPAMRATWTAPCKVGPAARVHSTSHALLHLAQPATRATWTAPCNVGPGPNSTRPRTLSSTSHILQRVQRGRRRARWDQPTTPLHPATSTNLGRGRRRSADSAAPTRRRAVPGRGRRPRQRSGLLLSSKPPTPTSPGGTGITATGAVSAGREPTDAQPARAAADLGCVVVEKTEDRGRPVEKLVALEVLADDEDARVDERTGGAADVGRVLAGLPRHRLRVDDRVSRQQVEDLPNRRVGSGPHRFAPAVTQLGHLRGQPAARMCARATGRRRNFPLLASPAVSRAPHHRFAHHLSHSMLNEASSTSIAASVGCRPGR